MSEQNDNTKGVETVLAPVLERLRREIEVDFRIAREDFARELADLRKRQQVTFLLAFAIFLVLSLVLVGGTYLSVSSLESGADEQSRVQAEATTQLQRLEEETRAQMESLSALERRLRVQVLEAGTPRNIGGEEGGSEPQKQVPEAQEQPKSSPSGKGQ